MRAFLILLCAFLSMHAPSTALAATARGYADILMDAGTGEILHAHNADQKRFPASLTKIMTLYLVFDAIRHKKITMNTSFQVPAIATHAEPCKMGLRKGQRIAVRHLVMGMITKSANDASITVAVNLAGSVSAFAKMMNAKARKIGMCNTHFVNANGLPDTRQYSTAHDLAKLSRALIKYFPKEYKLLKTRAFRYQGRVYPNHNKLLGKRGNIEIDGLKTGWIRASGSNLAASAVGMYKGKRRRLIAVVLGGASSAARNQRISYLLETGFKGSRIAPHTRSSSPSLTLIPNYMAPSRPPVQRTVPKVAPLRAVSLGVTSSSSVQEAHAIAHDRHATPSANLLNGYDPIAGLIDGPSSRPSAKTRAVSAQPIAMHTSSAPARIVDRGRALPAGWSVPVVSVDVPKPSQKTIQRPSKKLGRRPLKARTPRQIRRQRAALKTSRPLKKHATSKAVRTKAKKRLSKSKR